MLNNNTIEQNKVILARGNILVSASAGTGKTHTLIERIFYRVLNKEISLDKIVAITFTKDAANEMKQRLKSVLEKNIDIDNDYLKKQLSYLETANISTIHSFCLNIIKEYSDVIDLDPAIASNQLSDGTLSLLKEEAFDLAFDELIDSDKEKAYLLANYFSPRSEEFENLKEAIYKINNSLDSSSNEEKQIVLLKDSVKKIDKFSDLPKGILDSYYSRVKTDYLEFAQNLYDLYELYSIYASDRPNIIEIAKENYEYIKEIIDKDYYKDFSFEKLPRRYPGGKTPKGFTELKEIEGKDVIEEKINKSKTKVKTYYLKDLNVSIHNKTSPIYLSLIDLAIRQRQIFKELRLKEKGMDFNDMEHYCLEILQKNNNAVANILKDSYDEIYVDEFQDTSNIQNTIVNLIGNNNIFRVGDVKQSIYRFRKANPSIMQNLKNDSDIINLALSKNFRSQKHIVDLTNEIFVNCMNIDGVKNEYGEKDIADSFNQNINDSFIKFFYIARKKKEDSKKLKADFISIKIKELHEKENIPYKDFAVLCRSNDDKKLLKKSFEALDIPFSADAKEGFYKTKIVKIIASILNLIISTNEIDILTVLNSPYYDYDDNDLAKLVLKYQNIKNAYPYTKLYEDINNLKEIYKKNSLIGVLNELTILNNAYINKFDKKMRANFDLLFDKAIPFNDLGISSFINEIKQNEEDKSKEAVSLGKDEDAVKFETIHTSKGLQYKIVFFFSTSRFADNENKDLFLINSDLGIGYKSLSNLRILRKTASYLALERLNKKEEYEENIRLLYVALTRAEERLYMVDAYEEKDGEIPEFIDKLNINKFLSFKGFSDIILTSLNNKSIITRIDSDDIKISPIKKKINKDLITLPVSTSSYIETNEITPSSTEENNIDLLDFNPVKSKGAIIGSNVHKIIENLPNIKWTYEDLNNLPEYLKNELLIFANSEVYLEALKGTIKKELAFYQIKDNNLIHGYIDFVSELEDKVILIDFKTDKDPSNLKEIYKEQINLYIDALNDLYHKNIEAYLYNLTNNLLIKMN